MERSDRVFLHLQQGLGSRTPRQSASDVDTDPGIIRGAAGTVHLAQKNLAPVCRKLGLDYAPAMTGFSIRGGRSIPDILGVVVCTEHAEAVLQGFLDDQRCETHV